MEDGRLESGGDPGTSDEPRWPWDPPRMPDDARALGLDRNTEEGAWVSFAAALDPAKPLHKAIAWLLLCAFGLPVLLQLVGWLRPG